MKVRKAIIPAAGLGTRLLPNTKSIPKEMLPLVDKPVIQYIVEEAVAAGIEEILIITNRGKSAIENYFDYALIHNEGPEKKTSNNLTAIASYTLWDNERQRALFSAVDQVERPIVKISMGDIEELVRDIATQIQRNLDAGAGL